MTVCKNCGGNIGNCECNNGICIRCGKPFQCTKICAKDGKKPMWNEKTKDGKVICLCSECESSPWVECWEMK
jgi:hypothetical protein